MNKPLIYKGFVIHEEYAINYATGVVVNNSYSNWEKLKLVLDETKDYE